jgi:putative hemolysin
MNGDFRGVGNSIEGGGILLHTCRRSGPSRMSAHEHPAVSSPKVGDRTPGRTDPAAHYVARLAASPADVRAVQALRFAVFNLELQGGLETSYATGLDADPFDGVCDHLLVEDQRTREVVGTYRLQPGPKAAANRGYYSAQEFDLAPFEPVRGELIELGRACVHKQHRNLAVVGLLWRGIAAYAREHGARYLIGCSSLTSQDPVEGATMYRELQRKHLPEPQWRTRPLPEVACPLDRVAEAPPQVPKLLATYLAIGAKICGPPAIDREFRTIDFLTFLDIVALPAHVVRRYLS